MQVVSKLDNRHEMSVYEKNRKTITKSSSAEFVQRVVKVKPLSCWTRIYPAYETV